MCVSEKAELHSSNTAVPAGRWSESGRISCWGQFSDKCHAEDQDNTAKGWTFLYEVRSEFDLNGSVMIASLCSISENQQNANRLVHTSAYECGGKGILSRSTCFDECDSCTDSLGGCYMYCCERKISCIFFRSLCFQPHFLFCGPIPIPQLLCFMPVRSI